jgi:hypothetical protein
VQRPPSRQAAMRSRRCRSRWQRRTRWSPSPAVASPLAGALLLLHRGGVTREHRSSSAATMGGPDARSAMGSGRDTADARVRLRREARRARAFAPRESRMTLSSCSNSRGSSRNSSNTSCETTRSTPRQTSTAGPRRFGDGCPGRRRCATVGDSDRDARGVRARSEGRHHANSAAPRTSSAFPQEGESLCAWVAPTTVCALGASGQRCAYFPAVGGALVIVCHTCGSGGRAGAQDTTA